MNPQQFAQSIRSKYPNGIAADGTPYADIDDEELTRRVIEKYPQYQSQVKQQGALGKFVSGVKESFGERKANIEKQFEEPVTKEGEMQKLGLKAISPGFDRRSLRVTGQAAGFVGDVQFEALKLLAPQFVEDIFSTGAEKVAQTPTAQGLIEVYSELKEKHPEAMQDIEDVINIAGVVGEVEAASKAFKKTKSVIGKVSKVTGDTIDARRATRIAAASDEIDDVVGKVIQGKTKDISKAKKALSTIDTTNVKTYSDLKTKIDDGIEALASKVDDTLDDAGQNIGPLKPDDVIQTTKVGGTTVKQNFVEDAIDQLDELYVKIKEPTSHAEIMNLRNKFETEGLTPRELNDLSRTYNREFASRAFSKRTGEALTGVNLQAYENTRKGIKRTVRGMMPDDVTKMLDERMSDLYRTSNLVGNMEEKVNRLYQRVQKRGLLKRISMKVATAADAATFGTVSGFVSRFLPSNVGLKVMNSIDLERALKKNLKKINKLLDTSDIKVLEDGVVDILKKKVSREDTQDEGIKGMALASLVRQTGELISDIDLIPEVSASELDREIGTINLTDNNRVEITYKDGGFKNVSLDSFIGENGFLGKLLNDVGTKLGLPELNLSEKAGYLNQQQKIEEFNKRVGEIKDVVEKEGKSLVKEVSADETEPVEGEPIVVKSGGKDQEVTTREVPQEISSVISDVFGDEAQDAASVLHHPYGKQKKGEGQGENASFQVKDITISNEGYDEGLDKKEYVHDEKGKDGKWHSVDKGLFRINNRTFQTYLFGREERKKMYEVGIIDDPIKSGKITKADVRKAWEGMDDLEKNVKMAKIIRDKQGWDAWFAAPAELVKNVL